MGVATESSGEVVFNSIPTKEENQKQKDPEAPITEEREPFTAKIMKKLTKEVSKDLLLMKLALLLWFAAGASISTFYTLFLRHRGLTLQELSLMYTVSPIIAFLGTLAFGVLSDKLGKSKPILIFNLLCVVFITFCLPFMPSARGSVSKDMLLQCYGGNSSTRIVALSSCGVRQDVRACRTMCPDSASDSCYFESDDCAVLKEGMDDFSRYLNNLKRDLRKDSLGKNKVPKRRAEFSFCNINSRNNSDSKSDNDSSINNGGNSNREINSNSSSDSNSSIDNNGSSHIDSNNNSNNNSNRIVSCEVSCLAQNGLNHCYEHRKLSVVLWYSVLSVFYTTAYGSTFRFFDVSVMTMVRKHGGDYGKQRVFSMIGAILGPSLSGLVVQLSSASADDPNYNACLYFVIAVSVSVVLILCRVEIEPLEPSQRIWRQAGKVLKNVDVLFFIVVLVVQGSTWSFVIIFRNLYLKELNAESYQIGLVKTVGNAYGLPFLFASKWILERVGSTKIFVLAFCSRVVYCFGYSWIQYPWPAFLLELCAIVDYHLLWVAVMHYCRVITPVGLHATMNALAGATFFLFGRVIGSLSGGMIMSAYGGRTAFRVLGIMNLATGIIYVIFLCIRRKTKKTTTVMLVEKAQI